MTFAEINAAIAAGNTTDLEDAFKAMVEYPGHAGCIPGATPENLKHALDRSLRRFARGRSHHARGHV
jgi:hypothetical protein